MRRLNRQQLHQLRAQPIASEISLPAPYGGWNTIATLAEMPEEDAPILDNYYPGLGSVRVRFGYEAHATGVGAGLVQTVKEYNHGSNRKLLAASATNIYNATAAGAASSLLGSLSNGKWQTATLIANQLWANGADTPRVFDGTSFSSWTGTGSGLTPGNVVGCHVHKSRMYVWENNSSKFYYGAVSTIGGTYAAFDLGEVTNVGGNIVAVETISGDSGSGPDDQIAFLMSSGVVIVYAGNDPGDSDFWALVGKYPCGAPLGIRAITKDGGDLRFISHEDITSLGAMMRYDSGNLQFTKVRPAVSSSVAGASSSFGWDICDYPRGGMIIHNIPQAGGSIHQYVQNKATRAWCRYTGIEAQCWTVFDNELYFGGAGGKVFKAETGFSDDGEVIQADALTAWTRVQIPNRKRVTAVRPLLRAASATYNFGLGFDFRQPVVAAPATITSTGAEWDTSLWNVTEWSQEADVNIGWKLAFGTGTHVALRLRTNSMASVEWMRTDLRIEPGRAL